MSNYRRVTEQDRIAIKRGLRAGLPQFEIANNLGFHKSTISRELRRNSGLVGYRVMQAQRLASTRQQYRFRPRKLSDECKHKIVSLLERRWSPEQIRNRLKREKRHYVSHETIYRFVIRDRENGGHLWRHLRRSYRKRRLRVRSSDPRGKIQNVNPIEKRTIRANERREIGHWERDTVVGKGMSDGLLVIVDRKSRLVKIGKLKTRKADEAARVTVDILKKLPCWSITNDRGHEFWNHREVTKRLGAPVYFCNPQAPHERGTNENRIGLIRQYYRKRSSFENVSERELKAVENNINLRPMKVLNWRTPFEVFNKRSVALTS